MWRAEKGEKNSNENTLLSFSLCDCFFYCLSLASYCGIKMIQCGYVIMKDAVGDNFVILLPTLSIVANLFQTNQENCDVTHAPYIIK